MKRLFRFPWRTASQIRDEVDAELEFHLAMRAEELERRGLSAADARRETRERFGDVEGTRRTLSRYGENTERQTRLRGLVDDFWRDTRYAWRSLRRSPGFTAVAVVVLALGIGVNSAMFNLTDLLLLRTVQVADPERVVAIYARNLEHPNVWPGFSYPEYREIREQSRALADVAAFTMDLVGVGEQGDTRRAFVAYVSGEYFRTLGVPPARGRAFSAAEERDRGAAVVVMSHDAWMRNGGDPNVLGTMVRVNGEFNEVIGVAAEGFTGSSALVAPDLWLPMAALERIGYSMQNRGIRAIEDPDNRAWMLFGRLTDDASVAELASDLAALTARVAPAYASLEGEPHEYVSAPLPRLSVGNAPEPVDPLVPLVVLLIAMSGTVLLIACLNLANMFLARGAMRRTEIAIRQSLGGGRARLIRQFLTEGLLLALAGGAVGLLLAYWGTSWLLASLAGLMPLGITLPFAAEVKPWVMVATAGAAVVATLVFGLGPALKATRASLTVSLKEHAGDARRARRLGFLRVPKGLLIAVQMALSLMLLTAGGLFVRAAFATAQVTPGFALEPGLIAELDPALSGHGEARARDIFTQALARLRAVPQIEAAAIASNVAFGDVTSDLPVRTPGADADTGVAAHDFVIGEGYFDALGLSLIRGRGFTHAEASFGGGTPIAIVDEPLAERLFGSIDVVGRQVELPGTTASAAPLVLEIVGVAPGIRQAVFDRGPSPHLYLPFGQRFRSNLFVHVRAAPGVDPAALLGRVRDELRAIDPDLPVLHLETLLEHRDGSVLVWVIRAGGQVFALMGLIALALAAVGMYGVRAFVTAGRTREIGVRIALGATSGSVIQHLLRESLALTVLGLALGLVLAVGIARLLQGLLFEVSAFDPIVFAGATAVLAAAALLATYLPARRASRIDPLVALRHD
jgi:predicted permease